MPAKTKLFFVLIICLTCAVLAGCSGGSLFAETTGLGAVKFTAEGHATTTVSASMKVDNNGWQLELAPNIESGTITVSLADADGNSYGMYTFDADNGKHVFVDVETGTYAITADADNAIGEILVQEVVVLDGDGTPGS